MNHLCTKQGELLKARILGVLLLCMFVVFGFVQANAETSGDYEYTVSGSSATITKFNGSGAVTIPAQLDQYNVVAIGDKAFYGKDITSVTIPETVTTIGKQAFGYCTKLTAVTIQGDGLTSIGDTAFSKCKSGITYTIDALKVTYGANVFDGTELKKVNCKQSSTTFDYVMELTGSIEYRGPYFENLTATTLIGGTVKLTLKGASGAVTWSSSDTAVATVKDGTVTGMKQGTATIYAENSGEKLSVTVTVKGLSISNTKVTVTNGYTKSISIKNGASKVSGVVWKSADTKIATISSKGKIKGKKVGKTTVTGTVGGTTFSCKVTVKANKATIAKYSKNAYAYSSPSYAFSTIELTKKGYVVKGHFINGGSEKIDYLKGSYVIVKVGGKVVAQKYLGKKKLKLAPGKVKALSFTFSGPNLKKKVDLRSKNIQVTFSNDTQYYFTTTTTVTKEVTKEEAEAMKNQQ